MLWRKRIQKLALSLALFLLIPVLVWAGPHTGAAQTGQTVAVEHEISGARFEYEVTEGDTSRSIAAGFGEPDTLIADGAEPEPGTGIVVDNRHIAFALIPDGVVINIPQRMLFVFRDGRLADAWPVTVGRPDWPTPVGSFYVASHRLDPTWHVPPAIREEMEEDGIDVGDEVKPGPKNPLGKHFLGLDHGSIGIHATNHPLSIFLFGSHGCIRLGPDAAAKLFRSVSDSEPVEIVYQPVALAVLEDGRIFLESDSDPYEKGRAHIEDVRAAARTAGLQGAIDWPRASRVLAMVEGVARRIDKQARSAAAN